MHGHTKVKFNISNIAFLTWFYHLDNLLCGLVVRVSGYRYTDLGFDYRRYQIL